MKHLWPLFSATDLRVVKQRCLKGAVIELEGNMSTGLMCTPQEKPHSYIGCMARAEGKDGKDLLDEIVQVAMKRIDLKT
jgi:hypothetical protein